MLTSRNLISLFHYSTPAPVAVPGFEFKFGSFDVNASRTNASTALQQILPPTPVSVDMSSLQFKCWTWPFQNIIHAAAAWSSIFIYLLCKAIFNAHCVSCILFCQLCWEAKVLSSKIFIFLLFFFDIYFISIKWDDKRLKDIFISKKALIFYLHIERACMQARSQKSE